MTQWVACLEGVRHAPGRDAFASHVSVDRSTVCIMDLLRTVAGLEKSGVNISDWRR
jgi:hypothetical protein